MCGYLQIAHFKALNRRKHKTQRKLKNNKLRQGMKIQTAKSYVNAHILPSECTLLLLISAKEGELSIHMSMECVGQLPGIELSPDPCFRETGPNSCSAPCPGVVAIVDAIVGGIGPGGTIGTISKPSVSAGQNSYKKCFELFLHKFQIQLFWLFSMQADLQNAKPNWQSQ